MLSANGAVCVPQVAYEAARAANIALLESPPDEGTAEYAAWVDAVLFSPSAIARAEVRRTGAVLHALRATHAPPPPPPRPQRVHGNGYLTSGACNVLVPHMKALQLRPGVACGARDVSGAW